MRYISCLVLVLCGVGGGEGYGNGAPLEACVTMMPGHFGTSAQISPNPYSLVTPSQYVPGQSITVQITGADFQGFLIQARKIGTTTSIGVFTSLPSTVRTNDCPNTVARGANSATHNSQAVKRDLTLTWTPPTDAGHGTVEFVATVAEQKTVYWIGLKSSQLTEASTVPCPEGYGDDYGFGKCLYVHKRPLIYSEAEAYCQGMGGKIFQFDNGNDVNRIKAILEPASNNKNFGIWVGLTDEAEEGTFVWADDTPLVSGDFTDWAPQPYNRNSPRRNCVQMKRKFNWQWVVRSCRRAKNIFLCEPI
ncbi:putative ferric-chelate reductase 1 [Branchiostoma floridae x Branchiostoma japonicum]